MTIPIFIASSERFAPVEWLTPFSIRENSEADVDIRVVRPEWYGMEASGCTGFTNVRFAVPQLCRELGYDYGIYLDCDMLVLGDIAELYDYREDGKWVAMADGSTEVAVISASVEMPDKAIIHTINKSSFPRHDFKYKIPLAWNVEDRVDPGMKLLHFTSLDHQPWFYEHDSAEAVAIYEDYCARFNNRNGTESDAGSDQAYQ